MANLYYIRMKMNGHPLIGFLRTGCTTSFVSESFAKRAGLFDKIDRSNTEKVCIPTGEGGELIGWINDPTIEIPEIKIKFSYTVGVMADELLSIYCDKKFDMLLGVDILANFAMNFAKGLGKNANGPWAKYLTAQEIQEEMEDIAVALPDQSTSGGISAGGVKFDMLLGANFFKDSGFTLCFENGRATLKKE